MLYVSCPKTYELSYLFYSTTNKKDLFILIENLWNVLIISFDLIVNICRTFKVRSQASFKMGRYTDKIPTQLRRNVLRQKA